MLKEKLPRTHREVRARPPSDSPWGHLGAPSAERTEAPRLGRSRPLSSSGIFGGPAGLPPQSELLHLRAVPSEWLPSMLFGPAGGTLLPRRPMAELVLQGPCGLKQPTKPEEVAAGVELVVHVSPLSDQQFD